MSSLFNLSNKVALITGGTKGIGYSLALGLAREGVNIIVLGSSNDAGKIKDEVINIGQDFLYIQVDLTQRKQRINIIDKVIKKFGKLDILINNAGAQYLCPAKDYSLNQWDIDIELMLTSVLDISQQAYHIMSEQGGGKIIHISSISSFQGARNIIGYATVKHALIGMTKCMSNEWACENININTIAPGIVKTNMSKDTIDNKKKSEILKDRIPSGKFAQPEDLVGTAIYLASDASNHVNGTTIIIDGGWLGR